MGYMDMLYIYVISGVTIVYGMSMYTLLLDRGEIKIGAFSLSFFSPFVWSYMVLRGEGMVHIPSLEANETLARLA